MNINDYTYHLCDRFLLLFIAMIGFAGTSYIFLSGTTKTKSSSDSFTVGIQAKEGQKGLEDFTIVITLPSEEQSVDNKSEIQEVPVSYETPEQMNLSALYVAPLD